MPKCSHCSGGKVIITREMIEENLEKKPQYLNAAYWALAGGTLLAVWLLIFRPELG